MGCFALMHNPSNRESHSSIYDEVKNVLCRGQLKVVGVTKTRLKPYISNKMIVRSCITKRSISSPGLNSSHACILYYGINIDTTNMDNLQRDTSLTDFSILAALMTLIFNKYIFK